MQSPGTSFTSNIAPQTDPRPIRSPFPPLFIWLLLQLLALFLSAARVPFFALKSFPQPAELLSLPLMLTVQVVASAMLFPFLLRDLRVTVMVIAASWPMTLVAGFLTATADTRALAAAAIYLTAWLAGLALWQKALRSARAQAVGVAAATLAVFSGPIFWYLRLEYGGATTLDWSQAGRWGPIMGTLAIIKLDNVFRSPWVFAAGHLAAGAMAVGIKRLIKLKSVRGGAAMPGRGE